MSDFLGRLAARHAEVDASAIVPRAGSRFEPPSLPMERDVIESRVPASPGPIAALRAETPGAMIERTVTRVENSARERAVGNKQQAIEPAKRAVTTAIRIDQILKHVETIVNAPPVHAAPRQERSPASGLIAAAVVPRIAPSSEPRQLSNGSTAIGSQRHEQSEQTVVRVHIGRVEVRAKPTPPERPRVHRSNGNELPKPMSLERYLSEKDRA